MNLKIIFSKINEIHQDSASKTLSWTRIAGTVILTTVLSIYVYRNIKAKAIDFQQNEMIVVGLVLGAKVAQRKFGETAPIDKDDNDKDAGSNKDG